MNSTFPSLLDTAAKEAGFIYEMVYTGSRMPEETQRWYVTNFGQTYFDGTDFYASGVCVNPITDESDGGLTNFLKILPPREKRFCLVIS